MLTDSDIETIIQFTSGVLETLDPSHKTIRFENPGIIFELMTSSMSSVIALHVSSDGPLIHYEFPEGRIEETQEAFLPDGVHVMAKISFFGGNHGRKLLSLTKTGRRFTVDPIWDG